MALQVFGDLAIDPERVIIVVSDGDDSEICWLTDDGAVISSEVTEDSAEALLDFFEEDDRLPIDDLDDDFSEIVPAHSVTLPTKPGEYVSMCTVAKDGTVIFGWGGVATSLPEPAEPIVPCWTPPVSPVAVTGEPDVAQVPEGLQK